MPFEAQTSGKSYIETTSQKPATAKKKHTSKLTAKTGENQRKWETSVNKTAQAKIAEPLKKPLSKTITNDISHMVS